MTKVCLVAALVAAMAFAAPAKDAQLVCDEPKFDFGIVTDTQIVSHVFVLHNAGDATAVISNVHSACGCTSAQLTRKEVPPGETEPLVVRFNPKGRLGPQDRPVFITWNGTNSHFMRLSLIGKVLVNLPAVECAPASVDFGRVPATCGVERIVRIFDPSSNTAFRITGVTIPLVNFSNRIDTVVEGHDYRLTITFAPGPRKTGSTLRTIATVTTDCPKSPALSVPILLRLAEGTGTVSRAVRQYRTKPLDTAPDVEPPPLVPPPADE